MTRIKAEILSLFATGLLHIQHQSAFAAQTTPGSESEAQISLTENTLDAIIVHVGSTPIFLSELQKAVFVGSEGTTRLLPTGKLVGGSISPEQTNQILDQLIDQKMLSLKLIELGMSIEEEELDSEIETFLKGQNLKEEDLKQKLEESGETMESYREEFRKQLETQRFIGRIIRPLVTTNDEEVRKFYQQNKPKVSGSLIKLRSLMITLDDKLDPAEKNAKIQSIAKIENEIKLKTPFESLVRLYSEAPDVQKSFGELPAKKLEDFPAELRPEVKNSKPGSIIGPIRIGSSIFFFENMSIQEAKDELPSSEKSMWENKFLELKFKERLSEYTRAEKIRYKIRIFPLKPFR